MSQYKTATHPVFLQPGDRFIDTDETAEILGTTTNTLNYWRVMGSGPKYYRHGRNVRYLLSEVVEWGKSRCVDPTRERITA
jgi:predicted DNA-binding transcriptional regulator AlpA